MLAVSQVTQAHPFLMRCWAYADALAVWLRSPQRRISTALDSKAVIVLKCRQVIVESSKFQTVSSLKCQLGETMSCQLMYRMSCHHLKMYLLFKGCFFKEDNLYKVSYISW